MKTLILLEYTVLIVAIIGVVYFAIKDLHKPKEKVKDWLRYLSGAVFCVLIFLVVNAGNNLIKNTECPIPKEYGCIDRERILIDAIAEKESGPNNSDIISKNSSARGHLQIQKDCLAEANRLDTSKHFTSDDRFSRERSEDIFRIIQNKYNPKGDIEVAIRLWNGGPNYSIVATQNYYEQVRAIYNRMLNEKISDFVRNVQSLSFK